MACPVSQLVSGWAGLWTLWSRVGRGLPPSPSVFLLPRPALVLMISLPEDQHFPGGIWARSKVWQALSGWGEKKYLSFPLVSDLQLAEPAPGRGRG